MPTMKDVACLAGVSTATVSRVINEAGFVSEELIERVVHAMKDLNYQPNAVARSLRTRTTNMVALVIPDVTNPYFPELARGVQDVAEENDCVVILCNTDRELGREMHFLRVISRQRVDGLIINPSVSLFEGRQALHDVQVPVVLISALPFGPQFDSVMINNVQGACDAVSYLIDLGHRRIGLVGGSRALGSGEQRLQGYMHALREHGLSVDEELITEAAFTRDGGYECMNSLLSLQSLPTAVFASSDVMAIGALSAAQEAGLQVPDDVSVVGFDDIPLAAMTIPKLTTISQPTYETGAVAARLLFERIGGASPQDFQKVVLDHRLIVRESTGPLR